MTRRFLVSLVLSALWLSPAFTAQGAADWTIYITNDNCPDYTWGYTEEQTRQAFADIVKGHLDEMQRTDGEAPENQDRYNMAVAQEALCFVERYPDRRDELIRRIKEGRLYLSPYLCNSLWGFQSFEGIIRTFYPARRLERTWGIPLVCAHHIELPSLPWATPTILAGCGIRYLSIPYLAYDTTFGELRNPPLFLYEGPDGSRVAVSLDRWASTKGNYTQGAKLLKKPESIVKEWIPHYAKLGTTYPLDFILASGTHGDITPRKGAEARGLAASIIAYNKQSGNKPSARHARLVNATFPQFWEAVAKVESVKPFLPVCRGSLGHSWETWPVSQANSVAAMREGCRRYLGAEALLALAARRQPAVRTATREKRERAEWCWAMLSDHAWNGTNETNRRHNAELRRTWGRDLKRISGELARESWSALGLASGPEHVVLFNPTSVPRRDIVCVEAGDATSVLDAKGTALPCQIVTEGERRRLYFLSPRIAGFGFGAVTVGKTPGETSESAGLSASPTLLESPYYRIVPHPTAGGVKSIIHRRTGVELVASGADRSLWQTFYFDGKEHILSAVMSDVIAAGPVLARLRLTGRAAGIEVTEEVTVYAGVDRVDFAVRIRKPTSARKERLCQSMPLLGQDAVLRIATGGAVVRPRPAPAGDLLPGADVRRFAVHQFVSFARPDLAVTLVPLDSFLLRLDLGAPAFEALGNDQNYREVVKDQNGDTDFQWRYSLGARAGGYDGPSTVAFARCAASPVLTARGRLTAAKLPQPPAAIDPKRAIATCLKPADGEDEQGTILRLWEVAGRGGKLPILVNGVSKAVQTDLLERDRTALLRAGSVVLAEVKPHGYAAVRLLP